MLGHDPRRAKRSRTVTYGERCAPRLRPAGFAQSGVPPAPAALDREIYVFCDVSTPVSSASTFFLRSLHALHDSFRKLRSFVFIERISRR